MKTLVLFFFVVGIVMLTVGYNKEVLKKKEAEIHTVEYRFMPHNLYELQMNPELGNQTVESNFQQMFEGQSPFFDEDTSANRAQVIRETNKRRRKERKKQETIQEFLGILFTLIKDNTGSKITTDLEEDMKENLEEILNEFDILAVSKNQVLQHKKELLDYLPKIRATKYTNLKQILNKFFTPQKQDRIETFLFKLFYGRIYRRSEDKSSLVIVDREGKISFTPEEISQINPLLINILNDFRLSDKNKQLLKTHKTKILKNMGKVKNFNQYKEKIKDLLG